MAEKEPKEVENISQYLLDKIEEQKRQIEKLKKLNVVSSVISSTLNKKEILKHIVEQCSQFMNCGQSRILLVDNHENRLKYEISPDQKNFDQLVKRSFAMGESVAGKAWESGRSQIVTDASGCETIASPLFIKGKIIGIMEAEKEYGSSPISSFDKEIFEGLALHAAIAIENAQLYMAGICDAMTGLYNHEYFMEQLEKEFRRSARYGNTLSLIMLDIDHFKSCNDQYGHQFGDEVIIKIADFIKNSCRRDLDSPCRYGGEEFALILPETGKEGAMVFCERIRRTIAEVPIAYKEEMVNITLSGGVASLEDLNPENRDAFISMADQALYSSKNNGRNQISYYSRS